MTDIVYHARWLFVLIVFLLQASESRVCREGAEFECDDQCVPNHWRCDLDKDCEDGSDEINCGEITCRPEYVSCASYDACISADWWCDGERDCKDGSDENNCESVTCPPFTAPCVSGSKKCVLQRSVCDGQKDCTDGSDEEECGKTCAPDQVMCRNDADICIKTIWLCDGEPDCPNGTDEANCRPTCAADELQCADDKCIKKVWQCDGDNDCSDGSDEASCAPVKCNATEFKCADNTCIPKTWTCDGEADCEDDSDEIRCPARSNDTRVPEITNDPTFVPNTTTTGVTTLNLTSTSSTSTPTPTPTPTPSQHSTTITTSASSTAGHPGVCLPGRFMCGGGKCIPERWQCDNQQDCPDNSDELNCGDTTCGSRYVQCRSGQCIPSPWMCDGQPDCADGSDEDGCPSYTTPYTTSSTEGAQSSITSTQTVSTPDTSTPSSTSTTTVFTTPTTTTSTTTTTLPTVKRPPVTATRTDNDPLLLVFVHQDLLVLDLTTDDVSVLPVAAKGMLPNPSGLTVDVRQRTLYWTDVRYNTINSATLTGNKTLTNIKQLYTTGILRANGITLDWVHHNLYWSDQEAGTITVASLDTGAKATLLDTGLSLIQGLEVDPLNRWLFWACAGSYPKIEMSSTDGSNRRVLLNRGLQFPQDVAIDFKTKELYWADSGNDKIGVCDIITGVCRVLWETSAPLMYFAIDIYKKRLYWSDRAQLRIQRINREMGKFLRLVRGNLIDPKGLAVLHGQRQPHAPNRCGPDNGGCRICLPSPKGDNSTSEYICACPDNLFLQSDKKTCSSTDPTKPSPCFEGYVLKGDRCVDKDECTVSPEVCSHKCVNSVGGFSCTCYDGYIPVNVTRCKAEAANEVYLVLLDSMNLKRINLTTFNYAVMTKPKRFKIVRPAALDFDVRRNTVFWSDVVTKNINVARIHNTQLESPDVLLSNVTSVGGVAYDWVHEALYWTQDKEKEEAVRVMSLGSKLVATLVSTNLGNPRAISVDPARGWMYWTDWAQPANIQKCGMDGTSRHTIISANIHFPNGITIDYIDKRLYWTDAYLDTVTSSDLDGNDVRVIIDKTKFFREHMYAITVFQNHLYWTDWITNTVRKMDKRTGKMTFHHVGGVMPLDIKVFHKSRQITEKNRCGLDNRGCQICLPHPQKEENAKEYTCACADGMTLQADGKTCVKKGQRSATCSSGFRSANGTCVDVNECETTPCSHNCTNTPGSYKCTCPDGYALVNDTSCKTREPVAAILLVVDRKELKKVDLVNGKVTSIPLADESSQSRPTAIDYSFKNHTIYWTDYRETGIYTAQLEGDALKDKKKLFWTGIRDPQGIALDWVHNNLYWSDLSAHSLHVASLDTMIQKTLLDADLGYIRGLAVDPRHGWLYWAAWGVRPQIARCGMDGSNREVLIHRGLDTPNDVSIDYVNDRLYWVDGWATKLVSCDLNGKDCSILWKSKERLMIFSLDAIGNSIYWTEWSEPKIQDFDLVWMKRGPGLSEGTQPSGVAIVHPDRQPYARHRCADAYSNGCQICLPTPPGEKHKFRCACPDGLYLQSDGKACGDTDPSWPQCLQGYRIVNGTCHDVNECEEQPRVCDHLCSNTNGSYECACRVGFDKDNEKCVQSKDAFLILIDHVAFRRFNLTTFDSTMMEVPKRFAIERPVALDFDVANAAMYWSDLSTESINMATVDGVQLTDARIVVKGGASSVHGVAYDWVHKNLYWVDAMPGSEAIRVRSLRRMTSTTLVDKGLGRPRAIIVHPSKGWVFWTNWAVSATIERCGMDGTQREVIINDAIKWPNGITLDYSTELLYWTDAGLEMLSSSNIDGSNRRNLLHNVGFPKQHLFSVSLYGDWVYWTDWIKRSLKRANKRTGQDVTSYRVTNSPMGVKVFHSSRQKPDNDICGNNNGGCSHLCLPSPVITSGSRGFRCKCPDHMLLKRNDKSCV